MPKLGDRSLFSELRASAYLNHAAISPASDPVRRAAALVLDEQSRLGSASFGRRLAEREQLRERLAQLMAAESDEIALVPSTMYGLSALALSLPWQPGDRILAFEGEYPTNVSVWQRAAERFGLELQLLPLADFAAPAGPDLAALERALARGRVRLCAVSAVQFHSGLRMPLARIAELCHRHGAELAVDAVQALGCVPIDVRALGIDYLAAGAHKWLLGLDGAGVLYARRELASRLRPAIAGAMSHVDATTIFFRSGELRYDRPLRPEVRVFEGGMMSSVSMAALSASLELLLSFAPGAILAHVGAYLDALEPALVERGFASLRLPDAERRSGILSLRPPAGVEASVLSARLGERGVICASPDGLLRIAPHFANSQQEIPVILRELDAVLARS